MIIGENLLPAKKKKPPASPCSILSSFVLTTILISMQDMLAGSFVPLYVDKKFGPAFDATMVAVALTAFEIASILTSNYHARVLG